jgi:hypothetical protein
VRKEFGGAGEIDERYRVDKGVDERDDPKNEFEGKGGYPAAAGLIGLHLRGGEMHVWGKLVRMIERGKRREYFWIYIVNIRFGQNQQASKSVLGSKK